MSDITLSAQNLTRRYGSRLVVAELNLQLQRGEVLGLLGPNGAGKSTTIQMLTGNLAPSSGAVSICGMDLLDNPKQAKARIGYLPETPPLYRDMTVDEYLRFCGKLHRVEHGRLNSAVESAKQRCGIADMSRRLIGHLSKGYQQRVGIAQAILHEPDVIILDEPTVGLDPNQIRDIRSLIRELGDRHSVILSTHILPEVEAVCDRVHILHQGQMVFSDTITTLRASRQSEALVIGLARPPALDELRQIPGVTAAEALGNNLHRLRCAPGTQLAEAVTRAATEGNWGLTQLGPEHTSLEQVFAELTREEAA